MKASHTKNGKSISHFLSSFLSFGIFIYFVFHLLHGDRGYFAWKGVEDKLQSSQAAYEKTVAAREALENQVRMLRPDSIDLDMLDQRAREVLGFMKPSEVVILEKSPS
jgi:cell division protein FtsB